MQHVDELIRELHDLIHQDTRPIERISQLTGLARPTIYDIMTGRTNISAATIRALQELYGTPQPEDSATPKYVDVRTAANMLGTGTSDVYRMIKTDRLPSQRMYFGGGHKKTFILTEAVEAMVERRSK